MKTIRRAALCACLALTFFAFSVAARADNPPELSDAAATAYIQKVSDVCDDLLKALQAKDDAKIKELNTKFETVGKEGDAIIPKLSEADQTAATTWMNGQMKKLSDAGWAPGS